MIPSLNRELLKNKSINYDSDRAEKERQSILKILNTPRHRRLKRDEYVHNAESTFYTYKPQLAIVTKGVVANDISFSFYAAHSDDPKALLDAINFADIYQYAWAGDGNESFGTIVVEIDGTRQGIPTYAVPEILNKEDLPEIKAENNKLILKNNSYYCFKTTRGVSFTFTVKDKSIRVANTEQIRKHCIKGWNNTYQGYEHIDAGTVLSKLSIGSTAYRKNKEEINTFCKNVSIDTGFFTVDAGKGEYVYYYDGNGQIINMLSKLKL